MTKRLLNDCTPTELKRIVVEAGMSPPDFCSLADLSLPTYYKLLNGEAVSEETATKAELAIPEVRRRAEERREKPSTDQAAS